MQNALKISLSKFSKGKLLLFIKEIRDKFVKDTVKYVFESETMPNEVFIAEEHCSDKKDLYDYGGSEVHVPRDEADHIDRDPIYDYSIKQEIIPDTEDDEVIDNSVKLESMSPTSPVLHKN